MYQFVKELLDLKKNCPPLDIHEIDLSKMEGMYKKELTEKIVRSNFSKEILEKGITEFPVYRNPSFAFLGKGGVSCDYHVNKYGIGNLIEITQLFGKLEINPADFRYVRPIPDQTKSRTYCFYYNFDEKRYKLENNANRWRERVEEAEMTKNDERVHDLMWNYIDFYLDFWVDRVAYLKRKNLNTPTYLDCLTYLYELGCKCEDMRNFFAVLYVFEEIVEDGYLFLLQCLNFLEEKVTEFSTYLNGQIYVHNQPVDDFYIDVQHNKRFEQLERTIAKLFRPAYFIDPIKELFLPNFGHLYKRKQPTKEFANAESIKEAKHKTLIRAKKAFAEKGKNEVTNITDYTIWHQ